MMNIEFESNRLAITCLKQNQAEVDLHIDVKSHGIAVAYSILVERAEFANFLQTLKRIDETLKGDTELRQRREDNFISFAGDGLGHVIISGAHVDFKNKGNACQYRFAIDQTILPQLINELKELNS